MDREPKKGEKKLLVSKNQLYSQPRIGDASTYSNDEINELFQSLLDIESQDNASQTLKIYFEKNPFLNSYNPELLTFLLIFFNPQSEYGIKGVDAASGIISSLLIYSVEHERNPYIECYMNELFYNDIWPFFSESCYVILIFQQIIYLEENTPNPTSYHFLLEHNILEIISNLLRPDYDFLVDIICFIGSLNSYFDRQKKRDLFLDTYDEFINEISVLIPRLCEIVFTSDDLKILKHGCRCLGSYSKNYFEIGFHIIENEYFQGKCKNFENLPSFYTEENKRIILTNENMQNNILFTQLDELREIIFLIDDISLNKEIQSNIENIISIQSISEPLENIIIELLSCFLNPDCSFLIEIIHFIKSILSYSVSQKNLQNKKKKMIQESKDEYEDTYTDFIYRSDGLFSNLCEITFTSDDFQILKSGYHCLSSYGANFSEIGINIFESEYFQSTCKSFNDIESIYTILNDGDGDENEIDDDDEEEAMRKDNPKIKMYQKLDELRELLYLIDNILLNKERMNSDNSLSEFYSQIRTEAMPYNPLFLDLFFDIISAPSVELEFISLVLEIFTRLYLTEEEVNYCIESEFAQHLIDMTSKDYSFNTKVAFIGAIAHLVEFSSKEAVHYFIENDFFDIITDYFEELLTEIPDQIVDALELINRYGETNKECEEWCSLIFDNDEIVRALEKASNGDFDDCSDSVMPFHLCAQAFLCRRYNDCIPE